jgi:hypothetical protein
LITASSRFLTAVLASGAVLCAVAGARAEERVAVGLRYSAAATCPNEVEFVDEVNARVRRGVDWNVAVAQIDMRVSLERTDDARARGTLEVIQPGVEPTRREFTAATCPEVGSALALVAALTLDPNARTEALPARFPTIVEPPPAPPPAPVEPVTPPPPARPVAAPAEPRPTPQPAGYAAWFGPAGGVAGGYAPQPLVSLGLSLGVRSLRRGWSPGVQLTPWWGKTGTTGPEAELGSFSWATGRLEGCPVFLALAARLSFDPCLAVEVGRLTARGDDGAVDTPVTAERWWVAFGATLSLQWTSETWFARAGGLLLFPATRDELVFRAPDRSVHQANPALVGGTVALGFRFGT